MRQHGFLSSSLTTYAIIALIIIGLGYGLYQQIQRNGRISAENNELAASVEWMDKQRKALEQAQEAVRKAKEVAERDADIARRELIAVRRKYAELLDRPLPPELIERLRNALAEANGDMRAK